MIESGVKTEEYREIKPYWQQRLLMYGNMWGDNRLIIDTYNKGFLLFEKYDAVKFSYGYTKRTMTFEIESITSVKVIPNGEHPKKMYL